MLCHLTHHQMSFYLPLLGVWKDFKLLFSPSSLQVCNINCWADTNYSIKSKSAVWLHTCYLKETFQLVGIFQLVPEGLISADHVSPSQPNPSIHLSHQHSANPLSACWSSLWCFSFPPTCSFISNILPPMCPFPKCSAWAVPQICLFLIILVTPNFFVTSSSHSILSILAPSTPN